jgi:hypothetical protein
MGFSYRKSFKLAPGVRMTVSKSGVGYSVGGKGVRVTKRARGGVQTTLHVPGTGLGYTTTSSASTRKQSKPQPADTPPKKTRRRDKPTAKPQPVDLIPVGAPADDNPRRSRRRPRSNTPSAEGRSMMQQPTPQENRMPRADQPMQQPRAAHTDPAGESTAELAPARGHRNVRVAGRWYYVVMIATAGMFAWVPFLHAATRLKTAKARKLALIFGGLDALMYVLLAITPQDSQGHTSSGPISTVGGLLALGTIIVGCIMLAPLRRMAYEGAPVDAEDRQPNADPAIKAALAARARRDEARKLAANDPLLARELHIGRPDLTRTYDDGGLVDLNSAPAKVIAETCGIPTEVAATIVDARNQRSEPFSNVDELFVITDLPVTTWDRIRDRAVLLP